MFTLSLIVSAVLAGNTVEFDDASKYTNDLQAGISQHYEEQTNKVYSCVNTNNYANRFSVCHIPDVNKFVVYVLDGIK